MTPKPRIGPGGDVGIDEAMIGALVRTFYGRVRRDPVLGPVFEAAITDWDEHLVKLTDFWSSVLLMTGRFKGSPMAAHSRNPQIRDEHFPRWLDLFGRTAQDLWPAPAATLVLEKARMIGRSLQMGMAVSRGEIPPLEV